MNNITCDHTPLAQARMLARDRNFNMHVLSISCMFDLLACMYVQLSIVENESSSILQANCQPANTIANTKPSATVARAVWYSIIAHPTCSLTSHTSIAKIEGVAFSFGYSQSLESQSGLYSTIRNRLTTHSKPDLRYYSKFGRFSCRVMCTKMATIWYGYCHTCTVSSRKRAHYGISAHHLHFFHILAIMYWKMKFYPQWSLIS